jgi:hypothetical protein
MGTIKKLCQLMRKETAGKGTDGSIDLIEIDGIFYLEAQGEKTLIRAKHFR